MRHDHGDTITEPGVLLTDDRADRAGSGPDGRAGSGPDGRVAGAGVAAAGRPVRPEGAADGRNLRWSSWARRAEACGVARGVDLRTLPPRGRLGSTQVLYLRLESFTATGERRPPVAVALRAREVRGVVGEGNQVRAVGRWRNGILRARTVTDVSTGVLIRSSAWWRTWLIPAVVLAVLVQVWFLTESGVPWHDRDREPHPLPAPITSVSTSPGSPWPDPGGSLPDDPGGPLPGPLPGQGGGGGGPDGGRPPSEPGAGRVPFVLGFDADEAADRMAERGLPVIVRTRESIAPAGSVVDTSPPPGSEVEPGEPVVVYVAEPPPDTRIPMPSGLVGGTQEVAEAVLQGLGFTVVEFVDVRDATVQPGVVVRTMPSANQLVEPTSPVTVFVAEEPGPSPSPSPTPGPPPGLGG